MLGSVREAQVVCHAGSGTGSATVFGRGRASALTWGEIGRILWCGSYVR